MPTVMTPSALKWLAGKRARLHSELNKAELILEELDQRVASLQLTAAPVSRRAESLRVSLRSLDRTLLVYDKGLDPSQIAPINGWEGRYGKRGALTDHIVDALRRQAPDWMRTDAIERLLIEKLGLTFETPAERKRWHRNSLLSRLHALVQGKVIERLASSVHGPNGHLHWRLQQVKTLTLAELKVASLATVPVS